MAAAIKKRTVTLWVVLLLALLGLWLQQQEDRGERQPSDAAAPLMDYSLSDFVITTMDENGRPKYRLQGGALSHYAATDYAEMVQPHLEIYQAAGGAMLLDAELAKVYQGGESVLLQGEVNILRQNQGKQNDMQVHTRDVWFYADKEVAETAERVTIRDGIGTTKAKGMRVDTRAGTVHLLTAVRGEYVLE
ncbi:MAG TPA: LPS export ABC transporter periplasmic protein LptC [Candidatus Tenderia electrophaga]|uniref:LPS export ABC transporter periplasmic protein LptC n=1 Tax=Candidatus Tenderia electrophaga TaxID=1748243 RepID=A0A832J304_9GAMM|nr:LPS export ABC transporter periplasmic protein LptC [Candidatus Tenderia electrophaga]